MVHHRTTRRRAWAIAFSAIAVVLAPRSAGAQSSPGSATISGAIAVSAEVLPVATFDGGAVRSLTIAITPGMAARVAPADGVRTRLTYSAPTRVTATATTFQGPAGATVAPRLLCASSAPDGEIADQAFDCAAGFLAPHAGAGAMTASVAVGASVDAAATRRLPPGLYTGTVTLVATRSGS